MKNITVSVDEEVYHRARVRAAERRTSVSALVRKSLEELAVEETEFERGLRSERETVKAIWKRGGGLRASDNLSREELHNRDAVR